MAYANATRERLRGEIAAIREANQDVPAGRLTRGQSDAVVRIEGKLKDPEQFNRIIVAQHGGGPVYLNQVADVIDGEEMLFSQNYACADCGISLSELAGAILAQWKIILAGSILAGAAGLGAASLMKPVFTARTVVMPPQ